MIIFVGPQGSGKSTQIQLLEAWLLSAGLKVKKVHIMNNQIFAYVFERLAISLGRYDYWTYSSGERVKKIDITYEERVRDFWLILQIVSVVLSILLRVYPSMLTKDVIIAERYVPDSMIHLHVIARVLRAKSKMILNWIDRLSHFIPKGALIVFLSADYDTLKRRYQIRGTPIEPELYVTRYMRLYRRLLERMKGPYIDTSKTDTMTTFEIIKNAVVSSERATFLKGAG